MPDALAPALDSPALARSLDRWYIVGLACMAILIAAFPVYKRGEPQRRARAVEERHASYVQLGAASYARHCAACHGMDARGGGPAPTLATRDFLSTTSDAQLRWLIAGGVPGTAMVAYAMDFGGPFTAQDVEQVAEYLRSLEARASSVAAWRTGERAPEPPPVGVAEAKPTGAERAHDSVDTTVPPAASATIAVAGPPDIANGRKIYAMTCVACHGPDGRGAQLGPTLNAREFLVARTDAQITVSIERGVVGTTMIAWAKARGGSLDDAAIRDVVAYLRSWQPKAPSVPDWKTRRPTH